MESVSSEFESLVAQLRQGSEEAAQKVVDQFGPYIIRVVRRAITAKVRKKFDSQDFVQAVWASFFTDERLYDDVENEQQLVRLLARIARNKVIDEERRRTSLKYNVERERSINDSKVVVDSGLLARDPTPSQIAMAREQWNRLLAEKSKLCRVIVRLRRSGDTYEEIAQKLKISKRTVQRVLSKLQESTEA